MNSRPSEEFITFIAICIWAASCYGLWLFHQEFIVPMGGAVGDVVGSVFTLIAFFWFLAANIIKTLLLQVRDAAWHSPRISSSRPDKGGEDIL